ncbi:oxidoreductase [Candidatus Nitromaritima sp. SCGC AAA799-A02]|nr:oxidoreductase [Candidatus Nitromaritima sp. SCGC AAA799-A02]KMP11426.1 oxidoreductase [Candidatus Nitromaritima sp. SCGC AAA799-C22]
MFRKTDPQTIAPYLKDASNYTGGAAEEVVIPESVDELTDFLKNNDRPVTISGAGTGVTASRIPESGVILSMERFNAIGEMTDGSMEVGPAVTLAQLNERLENEPFFYPPNPTEALASIGGTLSTNASGARSYKFGVTRDFVIEADIVLGDGRDITLSRGNSVDVPLKFSDGSKITFPDISYTSPSCKNAAGYYIRPGMDWLDLFIGSDGTLGIFTRVQLKLLARPAGFISGILFFGSEDSCWNLVDTIRKSDHPGIDPCSLEYFDRNSLGRLRKKFDSIPVSACAALFFENDVEQQDDYDAGLSAWFEFLSEHDVLLDDSWFAQSARDLRMFHEFRHEIPVLLNEENSRLGRIKMGTDMAVPDCYLLDMMRFYRDELEAGEVDYVIFGHLGDNHLHINLLPSTSQTGQANAIYERLVKQILEWEGTVSAEHGIGKLKKSYFAQMVGEHALGELESIKKSLDPKRILGCGNIL